MRNVFCNYIKSFVTSTPKYLNKVPGIKRMHTTRQVYMSKPAVEYINPLTQKLEILKENKNKSGIYR